MTETNALNVIIWGHSDQYGGVELACELCIRVWTILPRFGLKSSSVGIACPERCKDHALQRLEGLMSPIFTVMESISIAKTDNGHVDPIKTRDTLLARFRSKDAVEQLVLRQAAELSRHTHNGTLVISCGEPLAVGVAKALGLHCVIITDILLPDAVRRVLEYGGCLSRDVASVLAAFTEYDRRADEAYLAPAEFCGTDYDTYFANGGVPAMSLGGLFYRPALSPESNPHLVKLQRKAANNPVVFVFGGGGRLWLELYDDLARTLPALSLDYAVLVPIVERDDDGRLRRKCVDRVFKYTLFNPNGHREYLDDPGSLGFWYPACILVVGRGGLVAQQVLASAAARDQPPTVPAMLFVEEPGHPQIEHERESLDRLRFVQSCTLDRFRKFPIESINDAIASRTAKSTRHRIQARYHEDSLERALYAVHVSYLQVSTEPGPPHETV